MAYLGGTGMSPTSSLVSSLPLEIPRPFPDLPLPQARGLVSQDRQERDRLALDQFGHQRGHVEVGAAPVEGGDLQEVGVAAGLGRPAVPSIAVRSCVGVGPVAFAFEAVEQPVLQGPLFLVFPRLGVPTPLVLGPLDQADFLVRLDELDPPLDQLAVGVGPVAGISVIGVEPCRSNQEVCSSPFSICRAMTISNARWPRASSGRSSPM